MLKKLLLFFALVVGLSIVTQLNAQTNAGETLTPVKASFKPKENTLLNQQLNKVINTKKLQLKQVKKLSNSPFYSPFVPISFAESSKQLKSADTGLKSGSETKFYGNLIWAKDWSDYGITEVPYGIYSFNASDSPTFTEEISDLGLDCYTGVYVKGKFIGLHIAEVIGAFNGIIYNVVNTNTWKIEKTIMNDEVSYEDLASCMTYDPTSDVVYALRYNADITGLNWATFDPESCQFTTLNEWPGKVNILFLATSPDGTIYGVGADNNFYSFDKADGTPTLIGSTGISTGEYTQAAAFDPKTGKLFWTAVTPLNNALFEIDVKTGKATRLYTLSNDEQFAALYSIEEAGLDEAPAAIADLSFSFDELGGLSGTAICTAPTKSYNGADLSGDITIYLKIDGEVVDSKTIAPGAAFSFDFDLTHGKHIFTAYTTNTVGMSPVTTVNQFVGYDYPKAVANLSMEIQDGIATLTWDAVTEGINNGYINADSITYSVSLYPDGTQLAKGLTSTKCTVNMPSLINHYALLVTASNGIQNTGAIASTDTILYGDAYRVPYSEDFAEEASLQYFNIIDHNSDNVTWRYLYGVMTYWKDNYAAELKDADDWLMSPPIHLEANVKYNLEFSTHALWGSIEKLKVSVCSSQTDLDQASSTIMDYEDLAYLSFTDVDNDFSVEKTGTYYIGFGCNSTFELGYGLYLDNINLSKQGHIHAPDTVANLTVEPDADFNLEATISFTTPTIDLSGETIDTITAIEIYRNNSLIETLQGANVNELISFTDINVPKLGFTTYKIVPFNSYGSGKPSIDSAFVGIYKTPYVETFDNSSYQSTYTLISSVNKDDWSYSSYSQNVNLSNFGDSVSNWLISPGIKLEKESLYNLKFNHMFYYNYVLATSFGTSINPDEHTIINSDTIIPNYTTLTDSSTFIVRESGRYYMGINIKSLPASWGSYAVYGSLDNFTLVKIGSVYAPGKVTNLALQPGENGAKTATISFNAPSLSSIGEPIDSVTNIYIFRNTDTIAVKTFAAPTVGELLTWTDQLTVDSLVTYTIVAENNYGMGLKAQISDFVGNDVPTGVIDLAIVSDENNTDAYLSWKTPVSEFGGYFDRSKITYQVYSYNISDQTFTLLVSDITDTTAFVENEYESSLSIYYYVVATIYNDEMTGAVSGEVMLGKPYATPFTESFANQGLSTSPWITNVVNSLYYNWAVTTSDNSLGVAPQDEDGGQLTFYTNSTSTLGTIQSPKIKLSSANNSVNTLTFWVYNDVNIVPYENSYLLVEISVDDAPFKAITDTIRLSNGNGWEKHSVSVAEYDNSNYVSFKFNAFSYTPYDVIFIDNIKVKNKFDNDLACVSLSIPNKLVVGDTVIVKVNVSNEGFKTANNYKVDLYCNDQVISTVSGNEVLSDSKTNVAIPFIITANLAEQDVNLKAFVNYGNDEALYNNTSNQYAVAVIANNLPTIDDLTASLTENIVNLNWSVPALSIDLNETESWEYNTAFSVTDFGDWKVVDLDGQYTVTASNLEIPNNSIPQAFMIWNASEVDATNYIGLQPYSGDQCLISWAAYGYTYENEPQTVDPISNDWLISPEVTGGSELSFWAWGISSDITETFEVLTSSTTNDVESFELLEAYSQSSVDFTEFSIVLPEDAKYFAIRHTTNNGFALVIDDIKYLPKDADSQNISIIGYNMYKNNIKQNNSPIIDLAYADTLIAKGNFNYAVSTQYNVGESGLSNIANISFTNDINSETAQYQIYGTKGQIILEGLSNEAIQVYNTNGQLIAFLKANTNREVLEVPSGVYLVKLNGKDTAQKVMVF